MHPGNTKNDQFKALAIDFFCGCGGASFGFRKSGIGTLAGFDNDPSVAWAFEHNTGAPFFLADISRRGHMMRELRRLVRGIDTPVLFSACAPCQPFSTQNQNYAGDRRKSLLIRFFDILFELPRQFRPDFVFVENVGPILDRGQALINRVQSRLASEGYRLLLPRVLNAADYGVPQNRHRMIFLAARKGLVARSDCFSWDYFDKEYRESPQTVRDAIAKLPPITAGSAHPHDALHRAQSLSNRNLKRIGQITLPGGSRTMWDRRLYLDCHKRHRGHTDVYGRMHWDRPAPTLTCKCNSLSNGRYGHPTQDRAISLREAAILQTMDEFVFPLPINQKRVAQQIGNAVPPKLAEKFGAFILDLIGSRHKK